MYVRREGGSSPIRSVNGQEGSAIATGTIRGGHIALGKNGRVHVGWNGSHKADGPKGLGNATSDHARRPGAIPVWGLPTVVAEPDGRFTILH
jgi:hypothetical protein